MNISSPETTDSLLQFARFLLDSKAPKPTKEAYINVGRHFGDEAPGSKRFLNHKVLWPEHVRPIERLVRHPNPMRFRLTPDEIKALKGLEKILKLPT